jgi:crotonobetainyl-CoA:carnitine CoA-transferase CaiB-like acyl-CoA transferase
MASIFAAMDEWASTMPDAESIEDAMAANRLAVGKLRTVHEVCATDWAEEREVVVRITDRGDGTIRIPNAPWRFDGSTIRTAGEPRYRGEDNRAVLADLLALDDATLDALEAQGVLTDRIPRRA